MKARLIIFTDNKFKTDSFHYVFGMQIGGRQNGNTCVAVLRNMYVTGGNGEGCAIVDKFYM